MDVWKAAVGLALVGYAVPLAAQHGSSASVNPYTTPEHAALGAALYRKQCGTCHGGDGGGTGAGPALNSGRFTRGSNDEALFATITKGVPGTSMPAFALTGLQTWQLVTHLRTLSAATNAAGKSAGDAKAGSALFRTHCVGCHRAGSEGGFSGPDLAEVGMRQSAADLRQSILQPDAAVPFAYWSVQLQTVKGEAVSGIRLNEDTSSVQIRDTQGRLRSILKSEIIKMDLSRKSPMPSFAAKLSPQELDHLLAYIAGGLR